MKFLRLVPLLLTTTTADLFAELAVAGVSSGKIEEFKRLLNEVASTLGGMNSNSAPKKNASPDNAPAQSSTGSGDTGSSGQNPASSTGDVSNTGNASSGSTGTSTGGTESIAKQDPPTGAAGTGGNLQPFTGTLNNVKAPPVNEVKVMEGDKEKIRFKVINNADNPTFENLQNALVRSCDIQKNKCANAFNNGGAAAPVGECDKQLGECKAAVNGVASNQTQAVENSSNTGQAANTSNQNERNVAPASNEGNFQTFKGTLNNEPAPPVTKVGDKFIVNGNEFTLENALNRSCDIQHNKCANAFNSQVGNASVGECGKQLAECKARK